jgi:hypothetical protein
MANGSLPDQIIESIAISNAKAIGEQPAILANLALANQVLNNNLQQQLAISIQTAMSQVILATMSKCVSMIAGGDSGDPGKSNQIQECMEMLKKLNEELHRPNPPGPGRATPPGPTGGAEPPEMGR